MTGGRDAVIQAGAWLAAERAKRGPRCSTRLIAILATILARRDGNDITIHQQQLADIETATPDKGPTKLQWWFKYVRKLIDEGDLDDMMREAWADSYVSPVRFAERLLEGEVNEGDQQGGNA